MVEKSQRTNKNVLTRRPRNYTSQGEEEEEKKVHYLDSSTIQQQPTPLPRHALPEESKTIEPKVAKPKKALKKDRRKSQSQRTD